MPKQVFSPGRLGSTAWGASSLSRWPAGPIKTAARPCALFIKLDKIRDFASVLFWVLPAADRGQPFAHAPEDAGLRSIYKSA